MRKILAVAVVLAVSSLVLVSAAGDRHAEETIMQEGFDIGDGGTLRVDVPDADIELVTGSGGRVEVQILLAARDMEWARERVDAMNLSIDASGSEVTVQGTNPRTRFEWGRHDGFSLRVRVELPERFDVDLNSDDGDISVDRLDGKVKIRTSDGDIRLGHVESGDVRVATSDGDVEIGELVGGDIQIKSSDGDIEARRIDGTRISIRTSDGDISLTDASGEIEAATSDGDIELVAGRLGTTTLTSGDGDITIRAAAGFAADVELRGEEVGISGTAFDGQRKESSARGRVNGGGPLLTATTRDGRVALRTR